MQLRGTQRQQRSKRRARNKASVEGEEEEKSLPPKRPGASPELREERSGRASQRPTSRWRPAPHPAARRRRGPNAVVTPPLPASAWAGAASARRCRGGGSRGCRLASCCLRLLRLEDEAAGGRHLAAGPSLHRLLPARPGARQLLRRRQGERGLQGERALAGGPAEFPHGRAGTEGA